MIISLFRKILLTEVLIFQFGITFVNATATSTPHYLTITKNSLKKILTEITESADRIRKGDVFVIATVQRNDTLFVYISHTCKSYFQDLIWRSPFINTKLKGVCQFKNHDFYIFGEESNILFRIKKKEYNAPSHLNWLLKLPIKDPQYTPFDCTVIFDEEGHMLSFHYDPLLYVFGYYNSTFIKLQDHYPFDMYEGLQECLKYIQQENKNY